MDDATRITQRAQLQVIAERAVAADTCSAPLYAAVAAGQIALIHVAHLRSSWPAETIAHVRRPLLVLIGGDPGWGEPAFGPLSWKCAKRLQRWAYGAVVHGGAGKTEHYRAAIEMTVALGRLAFIETTSDLVRPWHTYLSPVPTLCVLPRDGGAHPVAPEVVH